MLSLSGESEKKKQNRLTSTTTNTTRPGIKPETLILVITAQSHPAHKQSSEQIPCFILQLREASKKSL